MAPLDIRRRTTRHRGPPENTPRLRLEPESDAYIDGAWWPRSGELTTELPGLLTFLEFRMGPVRRVVYDRESWTSAPPTLTVDHHEVQLDAYPFAAGNTMYVFGSDDNMLVLQVVRSTTDYYSARSTRVAAALRRARRPLDQEARS
ncbi:DUF5994 family protein [Nocardia miyunensis]|uniref:DUF5994 family protein n=1 Tax=Nocardia miyunensis TaxID=282684 RepID=UPI00082B237B|nr:DUF5994 family protein [Nocardia miyunensis]